MNTFSNLEFFLVEAFRGIGRSPLMSVVAIGIVTITLTIFGFFLLGVVNLGNVVSSMGAKLDLTAYIDRDLSSSDASAIQVKIASISGIEKVDYHSKEESWKQFREDYSGKLDMEDIVETNPLPNTFAIKVRNPENLPQIAAAVSKLSEVDEVRYSGKLIKQVQHLLDAVRISGLILVLLLFLATLLIVVNTIRLTVLARETDIYIMRLVGATRSFLKWPFVLEGIMIGILGGVLAVLLIRSSYDALAYKIGTAFPFLPIVTEPLMLNLIFWSVAASGAVLGMLGGYISVSKLLKNA